MPELIPGPILLIDEGTRSLADGEIVKLIDVTVFDEATPEKILGQKLSEPEKLGKVKFGKDIDDKVKKGTLRRMETEGLHVQVGAGKKKQILDKYVPTELNHVNGAEKAKEHAKICTGYLDQVVAEFKTEMDKLTGLTRALTDYVPRRFKVVSSAQCDLDVMFQYNSLGTFDDLADFLSMPSPNRYHGEHVAQPVLFTSVASGGKSLVLSAMMHGLAARGKAAGWVGAIPLLPVLVELRKLAPLLVKKRNEPPSPETLYNYIDQEFESNMQQANALKAAVRMRCAVVLLDGIDEAVELDCVGPAVHFVMHNLAQQGHRVLLASRPLSYLDTPEWSDLWMRLELEPLSSDEQQRAVELALKQIGKPAGPALTHLCALSAIREKADTVYADKVPGTERTKLEAIASMDRFFLGGAYLPDLRQVCLGIDRVVRYHEGAVEGLPKSEYLRELKKAVEKILPDLDKEIKSCIERLRDPLAMRQALLDEGNAIKIVNIVCAHQGSSFKLEEAHHRFLVNLCRLVHKRQTYRIKQVIGADPISADSAVSLFQQILGRTDEMYAVCESYREGVNSVLSQRLAMNPELKAGLQMPNESPNSSCAGELQHMPLMDACTLHDKAIDSFFTRFGPLEPGSSLPEACVTDVVRSRLILAEGKGVSLAGVLKELKRPASVKFGAFNVQVELMKLVNGFGILDPTHLRQVRLVLKCTFVPLESKKPGARATTFIWHEVDLVYAPSLALDESSGAKDHYEGFKAALQGRYDSVSDVDMHSMLSFIATTAGSPTMQNLLALNFHKDATMHSEPLPRSLPEWVESGVHEFLAVRCGDELVDWTKAMLKIISETLRTETRPITTDDVESKLKKADANALKAWKRLYAPPEPPIPPDEEGNGGSPGTSGTLPPFLKLENKEGRQAINFTMPSVMYIFALDVLAELCGSSMEEFQKVLNSPKFSRPMRFGAGRLATEISKRLDKWVFDSMTPTGFETLCLMNRFFLARLIADRTLSRAIFLEYPPCRI